MSDKIMFTDLSSPEGHVQAIEVQPNEMKSKLKELLKLQRLTYRFNEESKNLSPGVLIQVIKGDGELELNRLFKTPLWDCKLKDVADFFYTYDEEKMVYTTVSDMGLILAYAYDAEGKEAPPPNEIEEALTEVRNYLGIEFKVRPGMQKLIKEIETKKRAEAIEIKEC